jgi:hypothetical protein
MSVKIAITKAYHDIMVSILQKRIDFINEKITNLLHDGVMIKNQIEDYYEEKKALAVTIEVLNERSG